ncbi:ATP-binding cassette domain-containing protein [Corynebacterium sp. 3HC-13]|uniref:ABC transporter ATP-binding protein n=1 Tax=Corynebacterium poyangense TaxID=2684405 RepID=UPI001CCB998B|nr:ABC transporter ATP-binding protein [Corynebacterium poyangense]MBZ8176526.1 ATP-binding cassette domain-containing protein [Corynebacterium poyangense]
MIEVQGLTKQYGDVLAVDDLSFTVQPGIITGFLGPNGAGKSTTMRMILGLDTPTRGQALINGKPYQQIEKPLHQVGALLNANARHPNRSAYQHLRWVAQANGISKSRVDEVLSLVGLSEVAKKKAGGFSLGMGQRLGLAAAMLGDPDILMLDEPVNGLDPEGIRWVRQLLRHLAEEGRTVLVSSHLLSEMALTADHLVVIGRGKLIADTSTRNFIQDHSQSTVVVRTCHHWEFLGALEEEGIPAWESTDEEGRATIEIPDQTTDLIGGLAYSVEIMLEELSLKQASLEDAFMEITGDAVQYQAEVK